MRLWCSMKTWEQEMQVLGVPVCSVDEATGVGESACGGREVSPWRNTWWYGSPEPRGTVSLRRR